jgi:inosose dehydratase
LHEPLRIAQDYGVKILLEPHGPYTDSLEHLERILELCDSKALGLNLDTGNFWLGGGDPIAMVKRFGSEIEHVHWKDWPESMIPERGRRFGAGMSPIPLGTGVVDIKGAFEHLVRAGFDGHTTLEVAGEDAVKESYSFLRSLGAF